MCAGVIVIGIDIAERGVNALAGNAPPSPPWTPIGERLNRGVEMAASDVSVAVEQLGIATGMWLKGQTRDFLAKLFAE
jgi:hypothetical protein